MPKTDPGLPNSLCSLPTSSGSTGGLPLMVPPTPLQSKRKTQAVVGASGLRSLPHRPALNRRGKSANSCLELTGTVEHQTVSKPLSGARNLHLLSLFMSFVLSASLPAQQASERIKAVEYSRV